VSWQRVVDGSELRLVDGPTWDELAVTEGLRAVWDEKRQAYRLLADDREVGAVIASGKGWETAWCGLRPGRSRDGVRLALRQEPPPADPVMSRAVRAALREDILAPWRPQDLPPTRH
jgi:hypothetical protein